MFHKINGQFNYLVLISNICTAKAKSESGREAAELEYIFLVWHGMVCLSASQFWNKLMKAIMMINKTLKCLCSWAMVQWIAHINDRCINLASIKLILSIFFFLLFDGVVIMIAHTTHHWLINIWHVFPRVKTSVTTSLKKQDHPSCFIVWNWWW